MKTVFIIPGYFNYPNKTVYFRLKGFFESNGYIVHIYWPNWFKSLSSIQSDFLKFFDAHKTEQNTLLGFSYGAMISFRFSLNNDIEKLILCSPSPYFAEDLKNIPLHYQIMALLHKKDFRENWKFNELEKQYNCPTIIFYGEKENKHLISRAKEFKKTHPDLVTLIEVKVAQHNIAEKEYFNKIEKTLSDIIKI